MKDQSRRISTPVLVLLVLCFIIATMLGSLWLVHPVQVIQDPPAAPVWSQRFDPIASAVWDSEDDPDLVDHSGIAGALPSRDSWISEFNHAKKEVIKEGHHLCQGCGRTPEECGKKSHDAHHEISVERIETETHRDGTPKWKPELKWSPGNLIILCRPSVASRRQPDDHGCHFNLGHRGESWSVSDPDVRETAAKQFKKLNPHKSYDKLDSEYMSRRN